MRNPIFNPGPAARRRRFVRLIPAAIGLVVLGDILFWQMGLYGGQIGLYLMAMLAVAVAMRPVMWRDARAWGAVAVAMVFAGAMTLQPNPVAWLLFWTAAGVAVLLPATARFDDGWRWFQRLFLHGLRSLVAPLIDLDRVARVRRRRPGRRLRLSGGIATLLLPVIGSVVILLLFASANPVLERIVAQAIDVDLSSVRFGRVAFWIAAFVLAWALLRPVPTQRLLATFDGTGDLPLPGVSVASVTMSLIAFNLLFAVQNAMDLAYLGGMVAMPDGITLAQYAHRGAYPLIVTALLAAMFVLVTLRPGSRTAALPTVRRLVVLWIAQNLILVGSSMLRTIDYVGAYSLTQFRIAALAWMALVGMGLVFTGWRMLRGRSAGWLINVNLAAAGLILAALTIGDTAGIAATWNVRHARDVGGTGAAIDLCYLRRLGGSALPALVELEGRRGLSPALVDRVRSVRVDVMARIDREQRDGGWTWRDADRLARARAMLANLPQGPAPRAGDRRCDGTIVPPPAPVPASVATPAPVPVAASAPALTREAQR